MQQLEGEIVQQVAGLVSGEPDLIANLSNVSALLNDYLADINWVGFYIMRDGELVLGPFQGKVACIRIPVGRGVCGTAAATKATQRIDDVHAFPGHIACDSASNSELVVPVIVNDNVVAVLDIDSPKHARFTVEVQQEMEAVVKVLEGLNW
ncbi:GAF domain-containing protein [Tolumonas osonensis]|uniref:GAF domain-containing protein n=1 Tax=Tolumonas osonensis TaxID=675874 RepID=A0A841GRJ4_9GAMM|nr:GAF domain-containing protein [Tolumonas osonensis]MBB6056293.1 GAF domain-containing protein [Tolumonas osonensis]